MIRRFLCRVGIHFADEHNDHIDCLGYVARECRCVCGYEWAEASF